MQANCCFTAARRGHASMVWLRPLLVLLLVVYLYSIYSGMVLYLAGSLFPPSYMRSLIWCDMMAAALTGLAIAMEVSQVGEVPDCVSFCASIWLVVKDCTQAGCGQQRTERGYFLC